MSEPTTQEIMREAEKWFATQATPTQCAITPETAKAIGEHIVLPVAFAVVLCAFFWAMSR